MSSAQDLAQMMGEKAAAVSATVVEVKTLQEAYAYALQICATKQACLIMPTGETESAPHFADERIIAAPNLSDEEFGAFEAMCKEQGFTCLKSGLRSHLGGIDIGLVHADLGIAETGTCVLASNSESVRIASMVSEIFMPIVPKSKIVADSYEAEAFLERIMQAGVHYTAFITGPSRTADIERVPAVGVHGPLELHLIILED